MHPAVRTQNDKMQDLYSQMEGVDCSESADRTRQEFRDEADTNKLLARYGVGVPQKPVEFGEQFNTELQEALAAINTARQTYRDLTPEQRREYPTWQRLLNALESGKLSFDMPKAEEKPKGDAAGKKPGAEAT